jgi:hypothetical protein
VNKALLSIGFVLTASVLAGLYLDCEPLTIEGPIHHASFTPATYGPDCTCGPAGEPTPAERDTYPDYPGAGAQGTRPASHGPRQAGRAVAMSTYSDFSIYPVTDPLNVWRGLAADSEAAMAKAFGSTPGAYTIQEHSRQKVFDYTVY